MSGESDLKPKAEDEQRKPEQTTAPQITGALLTTTTVKEVKYPWIPLSYFRWCSYHDHVPNTLTAKVYSDLITLLLKDAVTLLGWTRASAPKELKNLGLIQNAAAAKWSGLCDDAYAIEERSTALANFLNGEVLKRICKETGRNADVLCGATPLLFCSSTLDAFGRYGSGGTLGAWKEAAASMIDAGLPPTDVKEQPRTDKSGKTAEQIVEAWDKQEKSTIIHDCRISLAMACSGQVLYRFSSDIWLMLILEGIVLDTRPAQDNRESVTEPDQCLGGLRGWHLEESGRLKPALGTCPLVEIPTLGFLLHHAQINEAMFNSYGLFSGLDPDPEPQFVEYTSPGLSGDFQARLVLAPRSGAVFFSHHYNNYFHCTIDDDLGAVYALLKSKLVPWFEKYDGAGLAELYGDLKGLPALVVAKGTKASAKAKKEDKKGPALGGLGLHMLDLADACVRLPAGPRDELIKILKDTLDVESRGKTIGRPRKTWLFSDGKTMAVSRLDEVLLSKAPSFKPACQSLTRLLRGVSKQDSSYSKLENLMALLTTLDDLLASEEAEVCLHRAAALNLMWYVLKQRQEDDSVADVLKRQKNIAWKASPQGDHLLNDISGRVRRTEAFCGVHVFRIKRNVLRLLRQSRALRANMFPDNLELDLSSNANLWSFASDYFECALAMRVAAKGKSSVEGGLSAALVTLLICCQDRSVATRINAGGAHTLSTSLLKAKGATEAAAAALSALDELISAIPAIEADMESQLKGIFAEDAKKAEGKDKK